MIRALLLSIVFIASASAQRATHPRLMMTREDAAAIKAALGTTPLLDSTFQRATRTVDAALAHPISVPRPTDAGGPVHQRHKDNYTEMQLAGALFAITGDDRYAWFVRDMLLQYTKLWPTLPKHPMSGPESYGRLFWQSLNESVWLVYATQAYDCVEDRLTPADRATIEGQLFRPMAEYLVREHVDEFDRIHNHGTWMDVAVGMTGYVLNDRNLVDMALRGTKKDGSSGFLRQLDSLYSPDGLYTEGAYYARYAIMPFMVFAQVIANNDPGVNIFALRREILRKALYAALQESYTNGAFIPINDALKEKSILSPELVIAVDLVYDRYGRDPGLLSIVRRHNEVTLNGAGLAAAMALKDPAAARPFGYASVELRDGGDGTQGAIGMLRYGSAEDQSLLLMKYTGHGLSHGHYDKLGILYYDQGTEILQDYGAARFINVEPKFGGRYLPETKTWTRQTIAHNTVTVDGASQYGGKEATAEQFHANRHYFSASDPSLQVMSASVDNAYRGVAMQRTVALAADERFAHPLVIDVIRIVADAEHQYDLPFYYLGHLIATNVKYAANATDQKPLGTKNGEQHLWVEAKGSSDGPVSVSWLNGRRYYSIVTAAAPGTEVYFTRIGANDPDFNLRHEPGLLFRRRASSTVFATVLEPHGAFDPDKEYSIGASPTVTDVRVLAATDEGTVVEISGRDGFRRVFMTTNRPANDTAVHTITTGGTTFRWTGNYRLERR